ncbi:MAG TPA: hypothetical protein VGP12_03785, partial [Nitrosospira sp.]|nr:hypothetical protein [Nitrosospira sp.]
MANPNSTRAAVAHVLHSDEFDYGRVRASSKCLGVANKTVYPSTFACSTPLYLPLLKSLLATHVLFFYRRSFRFGCSALWIKR